MAARPCANRHLLTGAYYSFQAIRVFHVLDIQAPEEPSEDRCAGRGIDEIVMVQFVHVLPNPLSIVSLLPASLVRRWKGPNQGMRFSNMCSARFGAVVGVAACMYGVPIRFVHNPPSVRVLALTSHASILSRILQFVSFYRAVRAHMMQICVPRLCGGCGSVSTFFAGWAGSSRNLDRRWLRIYYLPSQPGVFLSLSRLLSFLRLPRRNSGVDGPSSRLRPGCVSNWSIVRFRSVTKSDMPPHVHGITVQNNWLKLDF